MGKNILPSGEVTESENVSCSVSAQDGHGLSNTPFFLRTVAHSASPSSAEERGALPLYPAQVMGDRSSSARCWLLPSFTCKQS